jgi:hypothetical protein
MPALWCYPWTLAEEGVEEALSTLSTVGVDGINLASHYHSVRSMQPRHPESLFVEYPGGCYFAPDPDRFTATPIDPLPNDVPPFDDPLAEVTARAAEVGIDTNAWVVCFHNSRLGAANPEYRLESAFGDPQDHALCPSHPAVRAYFAAVVEAVADRGVSEVQLESVGFQSVLHGHGVAFGHDKRQVVTTQSAETLLSQCFCDGCRGAAESHPVDLVAARDRVRALVREAFDRPETDLPALDTLVAEHPELHDLFAFRAAIVDQLLADLSEAAGTTPLNYYVMDGGGVDADDVWRGGVRFGSLTDAVDRVTALCYVDTPTAVRERIGEVEARVDCPVDVGLTFEPDAIRTLEGLRALVEAARETTDGSLHVYHHSLMTDSHLDWLQRTL